MKLRQIIQLILAILIAQSAGIVGSFFTVTSLDSWYSTLDKPSFNPPNWVFGPVWIVLYTLIGITLYILWQWKKEKKGKQKQYVSTTVNILYANLILNALWSYAFFGLQSPLYGIIVIVLVWATAAFVLIRIARLNNVYGFLILPYFLWVSYATVLNFAIWTTNIESVTIEIAPAFVA